MIALINLSIEGTLSPTINRRHYGNKGYSFFGNSRQWRISLFRIPGTLVVLVKGSVTWYKCIKWGLKCECGACD